MKETLEQSAVPDQEKEREEIRKQPIEEVLDQDLGDGQEEGASQALLGAVFDKLRDFEPKNEEEKFNKVGIQESLEDIKLLFEDDEEDPEDQTTASTLIALRGLEEIEKNYPLSVDFGTEQLKTHCAEQIQEAEGFGIEEIEDLDAMLEQSEEELKKGMDELAAAEELSAEQLAMQQEKRKNMQESKKKLKQSKGN